MLLGAEPDIWKRKQDIRFFLGDNWFNFFLLKANIIEYVLA
ncbi:hypothetical protein C8N47_101288 [Mangrovibacterium marinum]|uniref:Uncharacterized protein n=1 Tax=Mangrovibacterium marinum TaxID=1639118 RepID=A0A2T5C6R7_9BACT|nr:hypothetical protein C8N47_101288 [Mangrovibacterium marinum]